MREKSKIPTAGRGRFERLNVIVSILIAGWVPSILMLVISYTILTRTLESKILRDRQALVQLIGHLVGDDLSRTGAVVDYYQTFQQLRDILSSPNAAAEGQKWLTETYFSQPRIDGMFLADRRGRLIASIPPEPTRVGMDFDSAHWLKGARAATGIYFSAVHPRSADHRSAADIVGTVRASRWIDRSASSVSRCWSNGSAAAFPRSTSPTRPVARSWTRTGTRSSPKLLLRIPAPFRAPGKKLVQDIRTNKSGHIERDGRYLFLRAGRSDWLDDGADPAARGRLSAGARSFAERRRCSRSG